MTTLEILKLIGAIVGGGLLGSILTHVIKFRQDQRNDYLTIITTYREEFDRQNNTIATLKVEVAEQQTLVLEMRKEIDELKKMIKKTY